VARVLPLLLLVPAGCGAGGGNEVRQTVRDFVEATNARDGDTLCGELLTQEYLENSREDGRWKLAGGTEG
jgi:hypothetical protein